MEKKNNASKILYHKIRKEGIFYGMQIQKDEEDPVDSGFR